MILADIQENVFKLKIIVEHFEGSIIYKLMKSYNNKDELEKQIRQSYHDSLNLANSVIVDVHNIIYLSDNKELIRLIETAYFEKIVQVTSVESLMRVVSASNFTIPDTALRIISQNHGIIGSIQNISNQIAVYNQSISNLRQEFNRFRLTPYSLPRMTELPNLIESQISLTSLLPITSSVVVNSIGLASGNNTIGSITSKF